MFTIEHDFDATVITLIDEADPDTGPLNEDVVILSFDDRVVLEQVDRLLAEAGTDKTRIVSAQIWLADMADFAEMNAVWDQWVPQGHTPARATGEAKLATPDYKVEVIVTAVL